MIAHVMRESQECDWSSTHAPAGMTTSLGFWISLFTNASTAEGELCF